VSAAVTVVALPVASVVLWALLRTPVLGRRLVAVPTDERWHDHSTPTFGGVGLTAGLLAGIGAALAVGAVTGTWELAGIVAGVLLLFCAGLADDVAHLSPIAKLVAQFAAAGLAIAGGLRVELIGNDLIGVTVALVWLVGITNAYNLLDNMDGLAATLATVSCAYFAIDAATVHGNDLVLVLALSLGFACLGFLPFNLRPGGRATIFMGDSGSQALGFLLASLGLAASWTTAGTTVATMLLPLLVLAIPILDTTLVTVRRLAERRPVTQGGRDHSSHRLVYYGLSETKAVGLLALISVVLGATAVAYNVLDKPAVTAIGVLLSFVLLVQFGAFLGELSERSRTGQAGDTSLRHALMVEPRRLVEMLFDFALTCAVFLLAYLLVVGGEGGPNQRGFFLAALPVLIGSRYVAFVALRIYRRAWRYAIASDVVALVLACLCSQLVAVGILVATRDLGDFPGSTFVVDLVIFTTLVVVARLGQRLLPSAGGERHRVLIVGADARGRGVARSLRDGGARVVGFVDDDERLQRRRVQGVPVVGTTATVADALGELGPDEVVMAADAAPPADIESLRRACSDAGVPLRFAGAVTAGRHR
jgi:UDP-GlcNAc:undecaprenyl-phosphate/decaprenyl-phosphate GlcNAc-1-phosphate transferase